MPGVGEHAGLVPPGAGLRWLFGAGEQLQCLSMTDLTELASAPSDPPVPFTDQLRLAVAAYLAAGRPPLMGPSGPAGPGRRAYRGLMDAVPGPAEWLAWWSWPWRATGAGTSSFPSFAPQALNQPILPGWLFANSINVTEENSSSPETEREIVAAHSYGQQLGRIMDVVDELIRNESAGSLGARPVREFAELRNDIETIKARQAAKRAEQMVADLAAMKQRDPDEYQRLAAELRKVLGEDSGD